MTSPRLPELHPDQMTPTQAAVHKAIASGPRGSVRGPLKIWLHSPDLAQHAQALGQYARYDSVLSPIQSELAILITARFWSSGFEWSTHVPHAQSAGLPITVIADLNAAKVPQFDDPALRVIFDFCVQLHRDRLVTDAAFAAAQTELGDQAVVDLVGVCGYYTLISMTINAFEVPDGDGPALQPMTVSPDTYFRD